MKKYVLALLVVAFAATGAQALTYDSGVTTQDVKFQDRWPAPDAFRMAQASPTTTVTTDAPVTTTVKGGSLLASFVEWLKLAFGTVLAGIGALVLVRIRDYFGIKTTEAQKSVFQDMALNAVNSAAAKAETALKNNPNLDINVKDAVVADAVVYMQNHGADTMKSLGLDPQSGDAVEAMKARINRALNDPNTVNVTATSVTPAAQPLAPPSA